MRSAWHLACVGIVLGYLSLPGCAKKASERIDAGYFEGAQYRNDYFGMTLSFPETWTIQDPRTQRELRRMGENLVAGDDKNLQATLKAGEAQSLPLFMVFQHPLGSPVLCNANITCVAERVAHAPGIRSGADYLFHARRLLEAGQMKYTFGSDLRSETLAGAEFHVLPMELAAPGVAIKQEMYATIRKDYALLLTITFSTEEERLAVRGILNTLAFSP